MNEQQASTATKTAQFGSKAEDRYYDHHVLPRLLTGEIAACETQIEYELSPAFEYQGKKYRKHVYTPDFVLSYADGTKEIVEVKGRVVRKLQREYGRKRDDFIRLICMPNEWKFTEVFDDEI